MIGLAEMLLPLAALVAPAQARPDAAARALQVSAAAHTPEDVFGPLYRAVELAHVFPDNKTFADMIPRDSPEAILAAYQRERPTGRAALAAFVARHFVAQEAKPEHLSLRAHIRALWPVLARAPLAVRPGSSAIQLPQAYVVPGGRFQEIYYWDSYFTMLGLRADGEQPLIESMLADFTSLIERYGHIPNGTRTYYLSRSQPPFYALMLELSANPDSGIARRRLAALRTEYAYWMAGASCLDASGACQHVVRMPDGSLLNRYWDARDTPRDESYAADVATDRAAAPRPASEVNRDLRAGAESGWDYGSRFLKDGKTLATIDTTQIVPIDLNSLLWAIEQAIARRCIAAGDPACANDFTARAARRKAAIVNTSGCRAKPASRIGTGPRAHPLRSCRRQRFIRCSSVSPRPSKRKQWRAPPRPSCSPPAVCAPRSPAPASNGTRPTAGRRCNGSQSPGLNAMGQTIWRGPSLSGGSRR